MMNKLLIISTLLISPLLFAGTNKTESAETNIYLNAVNTKAEAYSLGHVKLLSLLKEEKKSLSKELRVNDDFYINNSIQITNSKVTVEEFASQSGLIQFKPIVTIKYDYEAKDHN